MAAAKKIDPTKQNDGGRPLKFKTKEELQNAIDAYFEKCDNHSVIEYRYGKKVKVSDPHTYTMSGLALALNVDRTTLVQYSKREEFFDTIREAKLRCQEYAERHLFKPGLAHGVIFNLKNNHANWKDESTVIEE